MSPEQLAKANTEHAHQCALFCWAAMPAQRQKWPELRWMYAVPNGGGRTAVQGARLKAEGVKPGVSDICLPIARQGYHGFYLELKKPGNLKGESDDQKEFGAFVTEQGYLYACVDNWGLAAERISWYMGE